MTKAQVGNDREYNSLTEEVFAFIPKWRPKKVAYKDKEVRKRHGNAKALYAKRLQLAKSLSQTEGKDFDDIGEDVEQALVENKLSPAVYKDLDLLLRRISIREAGYPHVKEKLGREAKDVYDARRPMIWGFIGIGVLFFLLAMIRVALPDYGENVHNALLALNLGIPFACYFIIVFPMVLKYQKLRKKNLGSEKKTIGEFTRYEDVRIRQT